MCGIYLSTINYSLEIVKKKLARINFRGPDFSGIEKVDNVIMGHNRLAIVDLDKRSNQPFKYLHLHIVFNGEVYNFIELRGLLIDKGFKFNTSSDTEVICAAYLCWGNDCVNFFNGMFSFVIYDTSKNILFGARDRLGKKPFYYYISNEADFECCSQLSGLAINNKFSVSAKAVASYLNWGYIPDPYSIYNEIKKLPAGYRFTYDIGSKKYAEDRYWELDIANTNIFNGDYQEAKTELKNLLTDAVKIRMFADVPVGVFLSGGIDSSLITALSASSFNQKVKTFTIKFKEKDFDESSYAANVAKHLGTEHHTIDCSIDEGMNFMDDFTWYFDEPFADSSAIPSLLLAKYTKQSVTVALSGDGGDEMFLGYSRYRQVASAKYLYGIPSHLRQLIAKIINYSPNYRHKIIGNGLKNYETAEELYLQSVSAIDKSWFNIADAYPTEYIEYLFSDKSFLERMSDFDIKTYLNGDINTKVDRASMAYALESRAPLMDFRILNFAKYLPVNFKYTAGASKKILRDILYEYVPKKLLDRPKAGFTVPLADWFRKPMKAYVLDVLNEKNIENLPYVDSQKVKLMINQHMAGKRNRSTEIWKLIILVNWIKGQEK